MDGNEKNQHGEQNECPVCGKPAGECVNYRYEAATHEEPVFAVEMECTACGAEWDAMYRYDGTIENVEPAQEGQA